MGPIHFLNKKINKQCKNKKIGENTIKLERNVTENRENKLQRTLLEIVNS